MKKVSVLMTVYNAEKYLKDAIESILSQTFTNFEFIIINDGSTDNSAQIIRSYTDERIKFLDNHNNKGLPASLNEGIKISSGEYIARMDADDISYPMRLEKQVLYMDRHQEVGVSGTGARRSIRGVGYTLIPPTDHKEIKAELLFETVLCHTSVILRRAELETHHLWYDESYQYAEDRELWSRASKKIKFSNIPEILVFYRLHSLQLSMVSDVRLEDQEKINFAMLSLLDLIPSTLEMQLHLGLKSNEIDAKVFIEKCFEWFRKLQESNKKRGYFDSSVLDKVLQKRWLIYHSLYLKPGKWIFREITNPTFLKEFSKLQSTFIIFRYMMRSIIKGVSRL